LAGQSTHDLIEETHDNLLWIRLSGQGGMRLPDLVPCT